MGTRTYRQLIAGPLIEEHWAPAKPEIVMILLPLLTHCGHAPADMVASIVPSTYSLVLVAADGLIRIRH